MHPQTTNKWIYSLIGLTTLGLIPDKSITAEKKPQDQTRPNILLIYSDDLNTRIGPYMNIDKHTPHLDAFAKQGVLFSRAYCQYPVSGPSQIGRASCRERVCVGV